jgi:hypothetical protein
VLEAQQVTRRILKLRKVRTMTTANQVRSISGSAYAQCKAAREAANRRIVDDISCNENAMVSSTLGGDRVGSMDRGIDKSIENCFKGARIEKNGVLVNQYLSCSFDPATLVCITCENEHKL